MSTGYDSRVDKLWLPLGMRSTFLGVLVQTGIATSSVLVQTHRQDGKLSIIQGYNSNDKGTRLLKFYFFRII